jgi:hypothetical protein
MVDEKAVDLRRETIAGALSTQLGHAEPHEDVPHAANTDIGVIMRMKRSENAHPDQLANNETCTYA